MFITPEKIGHSKTGDIASLMKTAARAIKLIKCTQTNEQVQTQALKVTANGEITYRDN